MPEWEQIRQQYPLFREGKTIYLNQGSIGLSPDEVAAKRQLWESYEQRFGPNTPKLNELFLEGDPYTEWPGLVQFRANMAAFIGAEPDEIYFTNGTTDGIAKAFHGLRNYDPNKSTIATTDMEYFSIVRVLHHLQPHPRRGFMSEANLIDIVNGSYLNNKIVQEVATNLNRDTTALVISDVLRTCGILLPIPQIIKTAKSINPNILTIVDGAQSFGQIPVDVKEYGCDVYATSAQKWMGGPREAGLLYISREALSKFYAGGFHLESIFTDNFLNVLTSFDDLTDSGGTPTVDLAKIIGLNAALTWVQKLGIDKIQAINIELAGLARNRLLDIGLEVFPGSTENVPTGMVGFRMKGRPDLREYSYYYEEMAKKLNQAGIICPYVWSPSLIRASFHVYNNEEDIEKLVRAVTTLV